MQKLANKTRRDYLAGALMLLIGLGAMLQGTTYHVGTLTDMGPGFFPVALGVIMAFVGISIVIVAKVGTAPKDEEKRQRPEWTAWAHILASIVAFVVLGKYGGLVPATFALVFISALGDRKNSWKSALALALAMVLLAAVVFRWALQLQFPLFSWG
ncbi:tripartite tricarboxylate transporter TctB family protein [Paraburkholderia sp. RL17-347-BIC-D]|uniref:tripartite tricarboxylate transporter TctB family protein n=1 Tax=Paraburkholderia sp. RL17-347-BIC-D TaxID=3031632 RepID=UPI0038B7E5E7